MLATDPGGDGELALPRAGGRGGEAQQPRRPGGEQGAGRRHQVDVLLQEVTLGQRVERVGHHAEVLHRLAGPRSDAQAAPQRDAHLHALGQLLEGPAGPLGAQVLVGDHVRATGAGVGLDPEHRADLVVLEAGGEDVAGAVALGVGHQHDRTLVHLADAVDDVGGVQRERRRVRRGRGHRLLQRGLPALVVGDRPGQSGRAGRAHELERLRHDAARAEELQQELRRDHVAAAVAADVEHQALRRQHGEQLGRPR